MKTTPAPGAGAVRSGKIKRMVGTAILMAVVVTLQLIGSYIKIGPYPLSLVLVPIVIGAAVYGPGTGAFLGFVFSVVVAVATITGADQSAFLMWTANPVMTLAIIFAKGTLAGWLAGLVYRALQRKSIYGAAIVAAVISPTVNTSLFCVGMLIFFRDILQSWAGGTDLVTYALLVLAGINYLLELGVNLILSPAIVRVLKAIGRKSGGL